MAAGVHLPTAGNVFLSVRDGDKHQAVEVARSLASMGFVVHCTEGTFRTLQQFSVACTAVPKIASGQRPNVLDLISNGQMQEPSSTPPPRRAARRTRGGSARGACQRADHHHHRGRARRSAGDPGAARGALAGERDPDCPHLARPAAAPVDTAVFAGV